MADKFGDPHLARLLHQFNAHHQIIIKEFSRIFAVGPDTSDHRGQMNDHIRTGLGVQLADS